ncbi:MAG: phasin family protein [Alphaproteobacteria bacterium]|nr:MAG: phasin family protein [Alphaproteobacteria bacterium]
MFTPDFTKLFDPNQYTQNMQKFFDWNGTLSTSKQSIECMKQVNTIVADTIATCTEKQFKFAQSTMEDCVETMRDLSSSKGIEDYMTKQSEIAKRSAEKAQSIAQEIATCWQKSQSQCTDIIGQQLSQTMDWSKSATANATSAAASAARTAATNSTSSSK